MPNLDVSFFDRNALDVAKDLLGKVIRHFYEGIWLSAMIIETEAYFEKEKGSHASLGFTEKRKALFMPPGTIYMYYARGGDSFNLSCQGPGNAVLIKSGEVYLKDSHNAQMLEIMQSLNPQKNTKEKRSPRRLCSGQTLLCKSLNLKVPQWNQHQLITNKLRIEDVGYCPTKIIQTTRLGIPQGRDEHLPYRFVDFERATSCTSNPLTKRNWKEGKDYDILIV